ncbi:hypothetical protein [uncultured Rheinheimera sp.]|nr:hypothetical protein [uncultured Rheinheimera sp.]
MAQPTLAGSASLHLRLGAFGVLYTALSVSFAPIIAFSLALAAAMVLSKL